MFVIACSLCTSVKFYYNATMKHTVYLIRHGQTDWNANRRLQGQTEVPMNDFGRSQVRANAEKLARLCNNPHHCDFVSSPIRRARETMRIIRHRFGLPPDDFRIDDRLKELDYGEFSTHTWEELRRTRPLDVMQRFDNSWRYVIPKGECYAQLSKRVLKWFFEVKRDSIVTAHAGVSRVLQGHFANIPENDVAFLKAPQDQILVLRNGEIDWL